MARLIGFGGPLIFILFFLLVNKKYLSISSAVTYSILIYVLSVASGIGITVLIGGGAIYAGVIAPIFYTILFSVIVRRGKS